MKQHSKLRLLCLPVAARAAILLALGASSQAVELPREIPLWEKDPGGPEIRLDEKEQLRTHKAQPGSPSGSNRVFSFVSAPTYSIHRPAEPNGVGLVICPGGGFRDVWIDREGHDLALLLKDQGITSLVLKYRTRPTDLKGPNSWRNYQNAVRADGKQAIRILRKQARDLRLQPGRIGICGFSAGGHLALSCALWPEPKQPNPPLSGMPNFAGLFYPGIPEEAAELVADRSDPRSAAGAVCPLFLLNARVDKLTPAEKCVEFYAALLEAGVNAELHVLNKGGHGFDLGLRPGKATALWPTSFVAWLHDIEMIQP